MRRDYEQPESAGSGSHDWVATGGGILWASAKFVVFLLIGVTMVALDLALGGVFMNDYSDMYGAHAFVTSWLPLIFTLATTGLQVAINARTKAGFRNSSIWGKTTIIVGWGIVVVDTATDVGGFTALYSGDVNVGANILPAGWFHDPYWMLGAGVIILLCGGQEKIAPLLYERWGPAILGNADDEGWAETIVRIGLRAGGYLYHWVTAVLSPVGLLAVVLLDVVLTPNFVGQLTGTPIAWGMSIVLTVIQTALWEYARKVAFVRLPDGSLGVQRLNAGTLVALGAAWLVGIADVVLDVAGYTSLIYGSRPGSLLPPTISWNWVITATIVAVCCFAGDILITEVLSRPEKGRRQKSGGSSGFGGGGGGFGGGGGGFGGRNIDGSVVDDAGDFGDFGDFGDTGR